jgi:hypothetical protein
MKKFKIAYMLLVLILSSCNSFEGKFNKKLKDIVGKWQLTQMTYTNENGEYIDVEKISSSIIFSDVPTTQVEGNLTRKGTLFIAGDSISFTFNLSPTDERINFDVNRDSLTGKPVYSIGKTYQYDYDVIDKNELVFTTDFEVVYPTNEILTNPVYVFERK